MPSRELIEAVAVTAELCGRTFSEAAARVFVQDLDRYPEAQVLGALSRCRREVRGILTVSDVVSRLEDGRPGVEQAWSMLPIRESQTAVWTNEMSAAFGAALPLIERGDLVGARMAFKESYGQILLQAREAGKPVRWWASLGHDVKGRKPVIEEALKLGRLTMAQAVDYAPEIAYEGNPLLIENEIQRRLADDGRKAA